MYSLNQQGIAIFAEVYIRQKKKVLYLCGKLKTYNHGILPNPDFRTVLSSLNNHLESQICFAYYSPSLL